MRHVSFALFSSVEILQFVFSFNYSIQMVTSVDDLETYSLEYASSHKSYKLLTFIFKKTIFNRGSPPMNVISNV